MPKIQREKKELPTTSRVGRLICERRVIGAESRAIRRGEFLRTVPVTTIQIHQGR